MIRRNLCNLLVLSLVISCVFAIDDKEKTDESDKKDEKIVSKRGAFHYSTHGHAHPAIVSASHYHLPPAAPVYAKYPVIHKPHAHWPVAPVPVATIPAAPVLPPHYHIVPGGASVTSYSVNYPRYPLLQRPLVPFYPRPVLPAFAPPVVAAAPSAFIPAYHHHHHHLDHHDHNPTFHHHQPSFVPHYHHSPPIVPTYIAPKPVAVPYPGHRHPKYPVYVGHQKPTFSGFPSQFIPFATPTPTFIPVAVPANPQSAAPPSAINPGTAQDTNLIPATQEFPQIPMPTQPTFVHQPTQPTMTSHGWRPVITMTQHHHSQTTQPTFTDKHAPYNYHAPAVPFNHDPSTNDIISGHGHMSSQLAHQLALYQHQQHLHQQQQYVQQQQQQENSYPYPAAAETFQQNYDQPSNEGHYHGLSSYQVPIHH